MSRAKRVDANQHIIVSAFRKLGYSVAITSGLGDGFPDAVVGKHGINLLVEIKDGCKPPSKRKLTEHEEKFRDGWLGQYCIVETLDDVMKLHSANTVALS